MDDNLEPTTSGWTFGKVVGLLLGLVGMAGFGMCTLCGLAVAGAGDYWIPILMGAGMTALSTWLAVAMIWKAVKARAPADRIDP